MRTIFYTLVFIVPIFLSAQVYDIPVALTGATQGIVQAQFTHVGGAGYQDILISTYLDARVAWYNGDGEGSFLAEHSLASDITDPFLIAQGYMNADLSVDLVLGTSQGVVYFCEKVGLDDYLPPVELADIGEEIRKLSMEDVNSDGLEDIVVSLEDEGIAYYPNNGDGTVDPFVQILSSNSDIKSFDFGDFNNDGQLDIVYTEGGEKIRWKPGMAGGDFGSSILLRDVSGAGFRSLNALDIDLDGDLDIQAVAYSPGSVQLFENEGAGTFQWSSLPAGVGLQSVKVVNIDADNDYDLVVADDSFVYWIERLGSSWGTPTVFGSYQGFFGSLDAKDIDNDGRAEVLLGSLDYNGTQYFENEPFHGFLPGRKISADAIGIVGIQLADMDGDGDKDIVSASKDDQKVAWYEKLSPGVFGPQRYITDRAIDTEGFLAMDYHGTGTQEVIVERKNLFDQPRLSFVDNDGTGQFAYPDDEITMSELYTMVAGHMDFDANEDLVMASPYADGRIIRVRLNSSNNAFIYEVAAGQGEVRSLAIADMDGDGVQDVVGSSIDQGLKWYKNLGNGTTFDQPQVIDDIMESYHYIACADMDDDDDMDIVAVAVDGGDSDIYWYQNDGQGGFIKHFAGLYCDIESQIQIGDVDGDGDVDILYSDVSGAMPRWALSELDGFNQSDNVCIGCETLEAQPQTLIEDADGDGDMDVYFVYDEIYYVENIGLVCPEDINRDGGVDVNDFIELNSVYGTTCTGYCPADINGDGVVGIDDFIMLNSAYGTGCN